MVNMCRCSLWTAAHAVFPSGSPLGACKQYDSKLGFLFLDVWCSFLCVFGKNKMQDIFLIYCFHSLKQNSGLAKTREETKVCFIKANSSLRATLMFMLKNILTKQYEIIRLLRNSHPKVKTGKINGDSKAFNYLKSLNKEHMCVIHLLNSSNVLVLLLVAVE